MRWRRLALLLLGCACGEAGLAPDPLPEDERAVLFADGDPLRALADDMNQLPVTLAEFEARMGIGRRCSREDSREIYATEERSSRYGGKQRPADTLLPRVAITGCENERDSHTLLVAATSPAKTGDGGTSATDPIAAAPVEVMSFDPQRGRYAFYELLEYDGVRHLVRIEEQADGRVMVHDKAQGQPLRSQLTTAPRCYGCHVHGEPMLGEMSAPWFGWLSVHKTQPERGDYSGQTRELLAQASQASALEVTVRRGLTALAAGAQLEHGVARVRAARALFCPVQLSYVSRGSSYPDALFVDPAVLRGVGLGLDPVLEGSVPVVQIPVRGQADETLAMGLVRRGFVPPTLALAVRVLDDLDDLSARRCALWDALGDDWVADAERRNARLRDVLMGALGDDGSVRARFARALLEGEPPAPLREQYAQDLRQRVAARAAALESWLPADLERRWALARSVFDRPENPLPVP